MTGLAVSSGFLDGAFESQRVFRGLLRAMAEPATIATIATQIQCPAPLGLAQAAAALTLLDAETPIWLSPRLALPAVASFLRFHTGAPIVGDPADALFALAASVTELPPLGEFHLGSDEAPERGATVIAEVAVIAAGNGRVLRGPGIPATRSLELGGVPETFWPARAAICALLPRGLDFVFTSGESLVALPRTTQSEA